MEKALMVESSITINAPPSRVRETLTNPSLTRKYMFDCEALSDWKPGSPLEWKGAVDGKVYVKGKVIEVEEERLLRYTVFDPNGGSRGHTVQLPDSILPPFVTGWPLHIAQRFAGRFRFGREWTEKI